MAMKVFAVYKGEKFLYEGTAKQCAKFFGVKEKNCMVLEYSS